MSYTSLARLALLQPEPTPLPDLSTDLTSLPAQVWSAAYSAKLDGLLLPPSSAVVVVITSPDDLMHVPPRIKALTHSPLLAIITPDLLEAAWPTVGVDDYFVCGASVAELLARLRHLLELYPESGDLLRRGDLVINLATCEVSVAGRLIELTFKEYELLKFLAHAPGRVHTRQTLLDRVWGYDYYGGDRTVDVHVRRLRSKLDDANHTFIDTVRHVGYRFRKSA